MLLCSLAFSAILVLAPSKTADGFSWINLFALAGFVLTVLMNLFCTVVVIQQMYLVNRISTSGSMGFEMAKSLYLNDIYVVVRHMAISAFFRSIPLFVMSSVLLVYDEINPKNQAPIIAGLICIPMVLVMTFMFYVHHKQRVIFHEKLYKMQVF